MRKGIRIVNEEIADRQTDRQSTTSESIEKSLPLSLNILKSLADKSVSTNGTRIGNCLWQIKRSRDRQWTTSESIEGRCGAITQ